MTSHIRIVLIGTTHPGNIGGVARAMKNMNLSDLALVKPKLFPHREAEARASGATDILDNAQLYNTLEEAIFDFHLVVGTSARERHIPWPVVNPRELAGIVDTMDNDKKVAIIFGREDRGLTNEELHICNYHLHIPVNSKFSSLNLAAAVQVVVYEINMLATINSQDKILPNWGTDWDIELAEHEELERLFIHMETTLVELDFLDPDNPRQLMSRLRRLYSRALLDKVEVNILRGILTASQKQIGLNKQIE